MDTNLLTAIRTSKGFSRSVTYLIIVAVLGVVLERSIYYTLRKLDAVPAENVVEKLNRVAPHKARLLGLSQETHDTVAQEKAPSKQASLSKTVVDVQDTLDVLAYELINKQDAVNTEKSLNELLDALQKYDRQTMASFDETKNFISQRQLAPVITQRHEEMVENYRSEMDSLLERLQEIRTAEQDEDKLIAVLAARKQLEEKQLKRSPQPFDPNDLNPTFKADPQNIPKLKKEAFTSASLFDNPYPKFAALGDFKYDTLVGANDPAYLAATAEITLSQAIKDKAAELTYDPVKIYQWVRNNIEWLPTWGAYQSADLTLSSLRGNAMDIASLTIALLRASGIPARYVHGTIELPADKFTNWTGDFANVEAAQHYARVGGIPTISVISGGQIKLMRLEHIWVEAAIDYFPSRGAKNREADTWVQMDPSYKQYEYKEGLDIAAISGLDGQSLADTFLASGTVNETEGWVQGFDPTIIQNAQIQAQQAMQDHIATMTDPTVGDITGGRKTIIQEYPVLPSSLPNHIVVTGTRYGELPDGLRNRMTFALGKDYLGQPDSPITLPMASLNNQRITLSFKPATADDEAALLALLPQGTITDVSQLPTSIPAYLINVIPELKLNGTVIKTGTAMRLGHELDFIYQVTRPVETQAPYTYKVAAGSFLAIAAMGQDVGVQQLINLQASINNTKAILEMQNQEQIGTLTRDDILGDMYYSGILGYFAQYSALSHILAVQQHANHSFAIGYGSYGYEPKVNYLFGLPHSIESGGVVMNVRVGNHVGTHTTDQQADVQFHQQIGMIGSALEHAIPEQMFVTPQNAGEAISAVKALAKAQLEGQRIYQITQENIDTALPNIHLDSDTVTAIQNAVMAGKEVTAHTDPVSIPGWSGAGYIVMDKDTGIGAYMISGGMNGGYYTMLSEAGAAVLGVTWLAVLAMGAVAMYLFAALMIVTFVAAMLAVYYGPSYAGYEQNVELIRFFAAASLFAVILNMLSPVALMLFTTYLAYVVVAEMVIVVYKYREK